MSTKWRGHFEAAKKALMENDYSGALIEIEKLLEKHEGFADVHNMKGLILYGLGRRNEASKAFDKALRINPAYSEASLNLVVVYNELGEVDKAQHVYELAKKAVNLKVIAGRDNYLDPYVSGRLANMHAELGVIYKDLGILDKAVYEFKSALEMKPGLVDVLTQLGIVYRDTKDFSMSISMLEEALVYNPKFTDARLQLGLTHYTMGDTARAKGEWKKVTREDPHDKMANMYLNFLKSKEPVAPDA
jgi:tetratricopeptide (TPR) repeat protein